MLLKTEPIDLSVE